MLRTENPPTNPTQPPKQALTVQRAVVLSARATTGRPGHSTVTFKNLLRKTEHALSDVRFYWDKRFNKFSLVLNLEGRRSLCFFPQKIVRHIGSVDFFLEISVSLFQIWRSFELAKKYGLQRRQRQTTFHITRFWTDLRRIIFIIIYNNGNSKLKVRIFDITICAHPPGPPACEAHTQFGLETALARHSLWPGNTSAR